MLNQVELELEEVHLVKEALWGLGLEEFLEEEQESCLDLEVELEQAEDLELYLDLEVELEQEEDLDLVNLELCTVIKL